MKRHRREFNPPAALDNIAGGYLGDQAGMFGNAKAVFRGDTGDQAQLFTLPAPPAPVRPEQSHLLAAEEATP